ncbi:MAG: hypothetical protein HFJ03_03515 [Lachnospira sp.]|jgi:CRISPR/Cas system CSM-associated protein Csm3 (group 7 of RAMP superfamily)|nr:hypothetical protein [Lachnospira sp.]
MKIKIELLSDLCTYSGETYNSTVNTDVVYDQYGIPYIPAKRLKGCLREACIELVDFEIMKDEEFKKLFGYEGSNQSAFSLSNAYLLNYDSMVCELKNAKEKETITAQKVLDLFTYTRYQTAVNLEDGTAQKNSLRAMRVVKKGLIFEAQLHWNDLNINVDSTEYENLKKVASIVKHIGCGRTRGLGLVHIELDSTESEETDNVQFKESEITENNKIYYKIHLDAPMICKAPTGNQAVTQDYIAGSKVLGLLAGQFNLVEYQKLIKDSELIVSNAYIMCGKERTIPARNSWQKEKNQEYDKNGRMVVLDMLCNPDIGDKQMTSANLHYVDAGGNVVGVDTEISYHHKRPDDKSIGRVTGEEHSSFYQLESIQAGQSFRGYIIANKKQSEEIIHVVKTLQHVRMGYGKNAEFGQITFQLTEIEPIKETIERIHDAVITLVSDLIMYNEFGAPSTSIVCLKQYLKEALNINHCDDFILEKTFLKFGIAGGFNITWKMMKPVIPCIRKGSVFVIHSKQGFDRGKLIHLFLGERVSEGYGEIQIDEIPKQAEYHVYDTTKYATYKKQQDMLSEKIQIKTNLIEQLREREEKRRLEQRVREIAATIQLKEDIFGIAVSRIRMIYEKKVNYQELLEQVDSIASDKTRKACQTIVKRINPDEFIKDYSISLTSQEAYRLIYHVYLTELKYHARIQKEKTKGGKDE